MTGRRLAVAASLALFAYLLVWMVQLVLLFQQPPAAFDRSASWWAALGGRLLACVVVLAAVHHLLDGGRRLLTGARRGGPSAALRARASVVTEGLEPDGESAPSGPGVRLRLLGAGVPFLTWALAIPAWAVLLRPWIEDLL